MVAAAVVAEEEEAAVVAEEEVAAATAAEAGPAEINTDRLSARSIGLSWRTCPVVVAGRTLR